MEEGWYTCAECGQRFWRSRQSGPAPTYCSFECRRAPYQRRILAEARDDTRRRREKRNRSRTRVCPECGTEFVWKSTNPDQIYCSRECVWPNLVGGFKKQMPDSEAKRRERERSKRRRRKVRGNSIDREEIFERDGWICQLCGEPVDPALQFPDPGSSSLDHICPLALGGKHVRENVQLAHYGCNSRKSATNQWRKLQGSMEGVL